MKKVIILFVVLIPMAIFANDYGVCGDNAIYHFDEITHTLAISGYGDMYDYSIDENEDVAPWQSYKEQINKVVIEPGITSIGNYAFAGCKGLISVSIPNTVISINYEVFYDCLLLKEITIPESVSILDLGLKGYEGSLDCNIVMLSSSPPSLHGSIPIGVRVFVPDNAVESYKAELYWENQDIMPMSKLEEYQVRLLAQDGVYYKIISEEQHTCEVTYYPYSGDISVPETVVDNEENVAYTVVGVGNSAFKGTVITSLSLPVTIKRIEEKAFERCSGIENFVLPSEIEYIGEQAFYKSNFGGELFIAKKCRHIGAEAFRETKIEELIFENVQWLPVDNYNYIIGDYAFGECLNLETVNLNLPYYSYGKNPFFACEKLINIEGSPTCFTDEQRISYGNTIIDGCLYKFVKNQSDGTRSLELISYPAGRTTFVSPEGGGILKTIGNFAFAGCSKITFLDLPNTVEAIEIGGCALLYRPYIEEYDSLKLVYRRVNLPESLCRIEVTPFGVLGENWDIFLYSNKIHAILSYVFFYGTIHIPYGTKSSFNCESIRLVVDDIGDDTISIEDGSVFNNDIERDNTMLTYTRTFNNTKWQALYIPFSMSYDNWKDDFDVAEINNFHEYDDDEDGLVDRTTLEVLYKKSGSTQPNMPYLIRAKQVGTKTFSLENTLLYPAEENSIDCSSVKTKYTFTGTYTGVGGEEMYDNGYYALAGGVLSQPSSSNVALGSFRWYLKPESRWGNDIATSRLISVRVIGEEDSEINGITDYTHIDNSPKGYYNLKGIKIAELESRGISIVRHADGSVKKVFKK